MTSTDDRSFLSTRLGPSRRSMLTAGAVGASAVALAACTQAKSADDPTVNGSAPAAGSSNAATGGASKAATGGSSAPAGTTGPALAKLSDIKVGSAIAATNADGSKIIIARPTSSTVAAFSAICTHQGCVVAPAGQQLDCPCHGSVFNATTGAVVNGPASRPLPAVSVKLSGENIIAG